MKTLNGERIDTTMLIEGMNGKGVSGSNSCIKLQKMYTQKDFPVEKEEIATSHKIKQWGYLKVIASDITQSNGKSWPLVQIGTNCMKALESLKVISSVDGGSYAHQSWLGWFIVGCIINMIGKKSVGCNRVTVIDAKSSNIFCHHFVVEETIKEVSLEEIFQTMYKNNFN